MGEAIGDASGGVPASGVTLSCVARATPLGVSPGAGARRAGPVAPGIRHGTGMNGSGTSASGMASSRVVPVRGIGRPPVVLTRRSRPSVETVTLPSVSVRRTRAPLAARRSIVLGAGWPYRLPAPALATATRGRSAARNASVDAVRLP